MMEEEAQGGAAGWVPLEVIVARVPEEGVPQGGGMGADLVPGAAPDATGRQRERLGRCRAEGGAAFGFQQGTEPGGSLFLPDVEGPEFRPAERIAIAIQQAGRAALACIQTLACGYRAIKSAQEQCQVAFFAVPGSLGGAKGSDGLWRQARADNAGGAVIQTLEQYRHFARRQHRGAQERQALLQAVAIVSGQSCAVQPGALEEKAEVTSAGKQACLLGSRWFGFRWRKAQQVACPETPGRVAAGPAIDENPAACDTPSPSPQALRTKRAQSAIQPCSGGIAADAEFVPG